jgi:hypothetical protein
MSYIGSTPTTQSFIAGTDYFNGDGATTAFTLTRSVVSVNDIEAVVNNVVQQPNSAYNVSGTTITFTSAPSSGTGNVYVRYMSTTTQSITPSQNTVSYSTMNTDMQNLFGQSFTNRIINGAMMIDQRNAGASVTASAAGAFTYTLDRWNYYAGQTSKFTVQQDAGAVTPPEGFNDYLGCTSTSAYSVISTDTFTIQQSIEGFNCADLGWGTANAKAITLSFWVRSSLTGTFGGALQNSAFNRSYPYSYTISAANTWEYKTITIAGDTTGTWLTTNGTGIRLIFSLGAGSTFSGTAGSWSGSQFWSATGATSVVGTSGATFYITGVQLEKGSTATSFDYRPYGTELALCQRYCVAYGGSNLYEAVGYGFAISTGTVNINTATPVQMRSAPSLTTVGSWQISDGVTASVIFVLSVVSVQMGVQQLSIQATSSGLTTYRPYRVETANSTVSRIFYTAEL